MHDLGDAVPAAGAGRRRATSEQERYEWADVGRLLDSVVAQLGTWRPDVVVGINRDGPILGGFVAKRLGLARVSPIEVLYDPDVDDYVVTRAPDPEPAERLLLVDDSYRRGDHSRAAKACLRQRFAGAEIRLAVLVEFPQPNPAPDSTAAGRAPGGPDIAGERNRFPEFTLPWDPT